MDNLDFDRTQPHRELLGAGMTRDVAKRLLKNAVERQVLAWLTLRLGSIWPGVMAHAINNFLGFLAMFYGESLKAEQTLPAPGPLHYATIAAGIALVISGFSSLRRGTIKS